MNDIYEFNQERIDSVLKLTKVSTSLDSQSTGSKTAEFTVLAECISVAVENHKVCINLPFGLGKQCIQLPDWIPNGEGARACLSINYISVMGIDIPTGIKVCVYVGGNEITCVTFGL